MKKRIGIMASSLQSRYPRGVHRVARSITENLALSNEFEFICLTGRIANQYEITYDSYKLSEWLESHPLKIDVIQKEGLLHLIKRGCNTILTLLLPPILLGFLYLPAKLGIKKLVTSLINKKNIGTKKAVVAENIFWNNIYLQSIYKFVKNLIKATIKLLCPPIFIPLFNWILIKEELLANGQSDLKPKPITLNDLDLVISFEIFEEIWELPIENYSTKVICWIYDTIPLRINEGIYWQPDRFANCLSKVLLKADRILCISSSTETDVNLFGNTPLKCKTNVVYLGHDIERFSRQYDSQYIQKILINFGIDPHIPYLICLGAIEPRKNIVNILRACILLRTTAPDLKFQLVMVGQEGGQAGFSQLINQARQYVPIIYTGYSSDASVSILLSRAKVFLYPSLWEGFGIPTLEAMTSGTLVITSDLSSLPEVCGRHAIYCDPYVPEDIGKAILSGFEMPVEIMENRVKDARMHASQFTWEKTAEQVMGILKEELLDPKDDASQSINSEVNLHSYLS
jgi:glycosyltransferase involved in cell wall biosynthesis